MEGANLEEAQLQGAELKGANRQEAKLLNTNLQEAQNLTDEQLTSAKLCRTTLPDSITLDPNRECEELGIDPETGRYI
nr:pentapeptide repeat-containing protein [Leptolyngbya sp. BC1307]